MNKQLSKMIKKSFIKKKRFLLYIIFIIAFSSIIINLSSCIIYFFGNSLKENSKNLYGEFHYSINSISEDKAESIALDNRCYRSSIFRGIMNEKFYSIYCDENYLELSGIDLLKGNFPKDEKSILCDKNFLYQQGYNDNDMLGASVRIENKEYSIAGVVSWQSYDELDYNGALIIYNREYIDTIDAYDNSEYKDISYNILVQNNSDNFYKNKNYIINKYDLKQKSVYANQGYLNNAYRNSHDLAIGYLKYAYFIQIFVCISLIMLSVSIIVLSTQQVEKTINVYKKIGINDKILFKTYIWLIIKTLLIISLISYLILIYIVKKYVNYKKESFIIFSILYHLLLYCIPLMIGSFTTVKGMITNSLNSRLRVNKNEFNNKNKIIQGKNISIQIAKQNNIYNKFKSIGIVVTIVFASTIFISALFYSNQIKQQLMETNPYSFLVTFSGLEYLDEDVNEYQKGIDRIEEEIEQYDNTYIVPIYTKYNKTIYINKNDLSKKYKDLLADSNSDINKQLENPRKERIKINVMFIGVRESDCEKFGLNTDDIKLLDENECIIVGDVKLTNHLFVDSGVAEGDELTVVYDDNGEFVSNKLSVKKKYKSINFNFENDEYYMKVIVGVDKLKDITYNLFPENVYIKCEKESKNNIINILKGNRNIEITDIESSNIKYLKINRLINCISFAILSIITIFTVVNIWLVLKIREKEIKHQCISLKILGLSDFRVIMIYLYDIIKIFLIGFAFSCVLSTVVCYFQVKDIFSPKIYIMYYLPYKYFGILFFAYSICIFIFGFALKRKLNGINIIQEMKSLER